MNDSERLSVATSNPFSSGSTSSSTLRRTQSALAFSTDTSGLLDVFAQVFAQMSTPIVDASPATVSTDIASSRAQGSGYNRESDGDASELEDDVVVTADEYQHNAREAFLKAIATANSRTDLAADEVESAIDNRDDETRKIVDSKVAKSPMPAKQIKIQSSSPPDASSDVNQGTETDDTKLGVGNASKVISQSEAEAPIASSIATTSEALTKTTDAKPEAGRAIKNSSESETSSEMQFADPGSENDDRDSRRSTRRGERRFDPSPAPDQVKAEPRTSIPGAATEATTVINEAPITPAPPIEPVSTGAVRPPAAVPTTAAAATTAMGAASVKPTSPATSSTSESTSAIPSAGSATSHRGGGAEKSGATKSSSANDAVTRAKLVQRVSKAFQHLGADGGTIRLRLAPAELGSVRVEMQIQGRKVNARVVAETDAASTILREHLPDLRARLESQGMQVERIEVETDENSFNPSRDSNHQSAQDREQDSAEQGRTAAQSVSTKRRVSRPVSQAIDLHLPASSPPGVDIRL